jgi:hypothetical protein
VSSSAVIDRLALLPSTTMFGHGPGSPTTPTSPVDVPISFPLPASRVASVI